MGNEVSVGGGSGSQLSQKESDRVRRRFQRLSGGRDEVSVQALSAELDGGPMGELVLGAFDLDGNGLISEHEVVHGVQTLSRTRDRAQRTMLIFSVYDRDRDGRVGLLDLSLLLSVVSGGSMEQGQLAEIAGTLLEEFDRDRDGFLSPDEFSDMVDACVSMRLQGSAAGGAGGQREGAGGGGGGGAPAGASAGPRPAPGPGAGTPAPPGGPGPRNPARSPPPAPDPPHGGGPRAPEPASPPAPPPPPQVGNPAAPARGAPAAPPRAAPAPAADDTSNWGFCDEDTSDTPERAAQARRAPAPSRPAGDLRDRVGREGRGGPGNAAGPVAERRPRPEPTRGEPGRTEARRSGAAEGETRQGAAPPGRSGPAALSGAAGAPRPAASTSLRNMYA